MKAKEWLDIEAGLKGVYVFDYEFPFLPRISALFKINSNLTSRHGGGLAYKTVTIFIEENKRIRYQNVMPINSDLNKLEKSYEGIFEVNYNGYANKTRCIS